MDKENRKRIKEFYERRDSRLGKRGIHLDADAKKMSWITLENGVHVPIDGNGNVGSGPIKGQKLSHAKSEKQGTTKKTTNNNTRNSSNSTNGNRKITPNNKMTHIKGGFGSLSRKEANDFSDKVMHRIGTHYYDSQEKANSPKYGELYTFTSHGVDHVMQVANKTRQASQEFKEATTSNPKLKDKFGKSDDKMLLAGCLFHDTGMDGDHDPDCINGDKIRSAHGINSAVHVLENRDYIQNELGVNPDALAVLVFAHTKSKSGIGDVTSPEGYKTCLDVIEQHCKKVGGVKFDKDNVFGGEPNEDNIKSMSTMVASLRLGDANREGKDELYTQSGHPYIVERWPKSGLMSSAEEAKEASIYIDSDGTKDYLDESCERWKTYKASYNYSKQVVLGERNMYEVNAVHSDKYGTLQEEITLKGGNLAPHCTADAIKERIGELNTIGGVLRAAKVKMTGIKSFKDMDASTLDAFSTLGQKMPDGIDLVLEYDNGNRMIYDKDSARFVERKVNNLNKNVKKDGVSVYNNDGGDGKVKFESFNIKTEGLPKRWMSVALAFLRKDTEFKPTVSVLEEREIDGDNRTWKLTSEKEFTDKLNEFKDVAESIEILEPHGERKYINVLMVKGEERAYVSSMCADEIDIAEAKARFEKIIGSVNGVVCK